MCTQHTLTNTASTIQAVQVVVIKFREHEHSASRMFVILIVLDYKMARQRKRQSVRIQSALCEVACEQNSCGLKIAIIKI